MPSRLLRCIAVSVFLSASLCFVTLAAFVYVHVCVCKTADVLWVDALLCVPFCAVFSILVPSVSCNTFRHSIHQIDSEGAEKTRNVVWLLFAYTVYVFVTMCVPTVNVHEAHTCVFVCTWIQRIHVCMCVYIQLLPVCVKCAYACTLRCHQYTQGQVHSVLKDSKTKEGAHKWPPELMIVMNYGRALSQDATPTSKNKTTACEAKFNRHTSQWKLK